MAARTWAENRRPGTGHRISRRSRRDALHHLTLAALLHDIGLLALPNAFASHTGYLDVSPTLLSNVIHDLEPNGLNRFRS